jgi:hypothetical protein
MKLICKEITPPKNPTNLFRFEVKTMTGDADDYHSFIIDVDYGNDKEVEDVFVGLSVLKKCYPHGRGGCDGYFGEFFDDYCSEDIYADEGVCDTIEGFKLFFFDNYGIKFEVSVPLSENKDVFDRIALGGTFTQDELKKMKFPKQLTSDMLK